MQNKETRISKDEMSWINGTFANNALALKTLRKIFLYEIEPENPIGMAQDMWTTLDLSNLSAEEKLLAVTARQMLIKHIEGALMVLQRIAGEKTETADETLNRLTKDSSK